MLPKRTTLWLLTLLLLVSRAAPAGEQAPPPARWIPRDAALVVELPATHRILDFAFDPRVEEIVTRFPGYREWTTTKGFRDFKGVVAYLESRLNTDWKTGLHRLLGGGVTMAVLPGQGNLLAVDAEDGQLLRELHDILVDFARNEAAKQGNPERVGSSTYRGVNTWSFSGTELHAIVANRFIMSDKSGALRAALDLRSGRGDASLAALPAYRQARSQTGGLARAMVNLDVLKQHTPLAAALNRSGSAMSALIFAGMREALREAEWVTADLQAAEGLLRLNIAADGGMGGSQDAAAFAYPQKPESGALTHLCVPRRIFAVSLYRDLGEFYRSKDRLFPQRTSGLIFFENMIGIYFSGRDLADEVLAELEPEIRLVGARQDYSDLPGTPRLRIPAFAAVFRMKNPEKFGRVFEEAWQKAIGMVNFTSGQQGQPGLIIDRPRHGDVQFTVARYSPPEQPGQGPLAVRYNFQPSLVRLGKHLIVSSTEQLARDLIDDLKRSAPPEALSAVHSALDVNGPGVAAALRDNREALVMQQMVNKGLSRQEAETHMDILMAVIEQVSRLEFQAGGGQKRSWAKLDVNVDLERLEESRLLQAIQSSAAGTSGAGR